MRARHGMIMVIVGLFFMNDYYLGGMDILPDVVGCLLMIGGLTALIKTEPAFYRARRMVWIILPLCMLDTYHFPGVSPDIYTIGAMAVLILTLVLVHHLCAGVNAYAAGQGDEKLFQTSQTVWKIYLYSQFVILALSILNSMITRIGAEIIMVGAHGAVMYLLGKTAAKLPSIRQASGSNDTE